MRQVSLGVGALLGAEGIGVGGFVGGGVGGTVGGTVGLGVGDLVEAIRVTSKFCAQNAPTI